MLVRVMPRCRGAGQDLHFLYPASSASKHSNKAVAAKISFTIAAKRILLDGRPLATPRSR